LKGRILLPLAECVASLRTNDLGHIDGRAFVLDQTHSLMNVKEKLRVECKRQAAHLGSRTIQQRVNDSSNLDK
jgi:hypothetical protein